MEISLSILLVFITISVVVTVDNSATNHYLRCLHESQCQKLLKGAYCCPTGTCCNFFIRDSKKVISRCKRIRPDLTLYCQDGDKHILSDKDLQDSRFYDTPPNKGKVCLKRKRNDGSYYCFGGTDSEEEEFKVNGSEPTDGEAKALIMGPSQTEIQTEIKDFVIGDVPKHMHYTITKSRDRVFHIPGAV